MNYVLSGIIGVVLGIAATEAYHAAMVNDNECVWKNKFRGAQRNISRVFDHWHGMQESIPDGGKNVYIDGKLDGCAECLEIMNEFGGENND